VNKLPIHAGPIKDLPGAKEKHIVVSMLVLSDFLAQHVEAAIDALNQCTAKDFESHGIYGKSKVEPVYALLFGKNFVDLHAAQGHADKTKGQEKEVARDTEHDEAPASPSKKREPPMQVHTLMLDVLRAIAEVLRAHVQGLPASGPYAIQDDSPWQMQMISEPFELTSQLIKSPLVPETNIQLAVRLQQQVREDHALARTRPSSAPPEGSGANSSKELSRSASPRKEQVSKNKAESNEFYREFQGSDGNKRSLSPKARSKLRPSTARICTRSSLVDTISDSDHLALAVEEIVGVVEAYFREFVPRRAEAAARLQAAKQAEAAFLATEQVLQFVSCLRPMYDKPVCQTVEDVQQAATVACDQLVVLAHSGLALSFPHIEFIRCAVDSAGLTFLDNPPATDAFQRLRWAEAIMSVQLTPLPILRKTLERIAKLLNVEELQDIAALSEPPEAGIKGLRAAAAERLFAALAWVVDPDCSCDQRWEQTRRIVTDSGFMERLCSWDPMENSMAHRLNRAREVLVEVWSWVATGCDGSHILQILFAWLSLAVATSPLAEIAKELKPVHRVIESGLEKVRHARPENKVTAAAKAWTAALFLLDGRDEVWWWLGLVRGSVQANKPWTDSEEGGVGAAQEGFNVDPEDEWQQGEDPFDGANVDDDEELEQDSPKVVKTSWNEDEEELEKELDASDLQSDMVPYTGY